jgi:hypothetical protein
MEGNMGIEMTEIERSMIRNLCECASLDRTKKSAAGEVLCFFNDRYHGKSALRAVTHCFVKPACA